MIDVDAELVRLEHALGRNLTPDEREKTAAWLRAIMAAAASPLNMAVLK